MSLHFRTSLAAFLCLLAIQLSVTPSVGQDQQPMLLPVDGTRLAIQRGDTTITEFDVEIADDGGERAQGLMFRHDFPEDRAMLFVFEENREVFFWMKNTPKPLDMLFVRPDGEIRSIATGTTPYSEKQVGSGGPVLYVLEINAGASQRQGIKVGDRLSHPIISGER